MNRAELLIYEGHTCRVKFNVESRKVPKLGNEQNRVGIVCAVTMKVLVLWPLECEDEIFISLKDIVSCMRV